MLRRIVAAERRQNLNSADLSFFANGAGGDVNAAEPEQLFLPRLRLVLLFHLSLVIAKELAACSNVISTFPVCQQAEVPYPNVSIRQYMQKESSDELIGLKGHHLLLIVICVITPSERNIAVFGLDDTIVADGDPVGISTEILQNTANAVEGRLAVDNPLLVIKLSSEHLGCMGITEITYSSGEDKITVLKPCFQMIEELPLEQRRHYPDRDEEAFAAGYPVIFIAGQAAAGNDAMDMRMVHQILSPGMKDADKADAGTEMFRII